MQLPKIPQCSCCKDYTFSAEPTLALMYAGSYEGGELLKLCTDCREKHGATWDNKKGMYVFTTH